jgi:outer membrane protein assembly factor BamA
MLRKSVAVGCFLSLLGIAVAETHLPGTNQSIRHIVLEGVTAISAAEQQRIVEVVLNQIRAGIHDNGKSYFDEITERIRFAFQKRGYFKVRVDDPFIKLSATMPANRSLMANRSLI